MALCPDCGARRASPTSTRCGTCGHLGFPIREPWDDGLQRLGYLPAHEPVRWRTGVPGLDHVLSGGLPRGDVVMLAGEPGIGKSTLLLQVAGRLGARRTVLYAHAEEREERIGARAARLGIDPRADVVTTGETALRRLFGLAERAAARVVLVDPVQALWDPAGGSGTAGTSHMLRAVGARLVEWAKDTGRTVMFTCHVDKEGRFAGPKVLEHLPDCHLEYVGKPERAARELRVLKNRSGESGRVAWLEMRADGLHTVDGPPAEEEEAATTEASASESTRRRSRSGRSPSARRSGAP